MTPQNSQFVNAPFTVSMMLSKAVYQVVLWVERRLHPNMK